MAIQCWFTCHVIAQVPSPGLPQEGSFPRALHAKYLNCLTVRGKNWTWSVNLGTACPGFLSLEGLVILDTHESHIFKKKRRKKVHLNSLFDLSLFLPQEIFKKCMFANWPLPYITHPFNQLAHSPHELIMSSSDYRKQQHIYSTVQYSKLDVLKKVCFLKKVFVLIYFIRD